eukprot:Phypoly_transcript_07050.p1 GENE.Phypoly_transcript_07050~~Phypoly_transcript_07050.p1  ORF type:complete len:439 (+),score=73.58 Phypoly_transcript_07050:122-1438(+)
MSLIEGDAYFPLFSTAEIPIDFTAAGLVPDSPGKLQQYARRPSFALSNSQAVPANINFQNLGLDEPLFSLFMNGPDKMDLNSGFAKGFQIPEELLLQSSMVPDLRKMEGLNMMGMDQRQFAQMGIMPSDPMINGDFNMVPQLSPNNNPGIKDENAGKGANSKKRKFIQNPVKEQLPGLPVPDGQPLTPEEERNMKRQRRLVKNREAAQLFRQRQKAYIQDLEKKVADLSATNNDFRARVELLNSENKLIKEQLLYLRNFITQAVSFSFPKSPGSEDGAGATSPSALLGPMPAGLTLPPEILGAMSNMPNMALGLMGAMGSGCGIPGLLPPNFAETFSSSSLPTASPVSSPSTPSPSQPHMETNPIKLARPASPGASPIASGSAMLIPPPTKPLNTSHNGMNAVVPQFSPPSPQQLMVPDGADIKVKFDAQGNIVKQAK